MEKYGVEETSEKKAENDYTPTGACPQCKTPLRPIDETGVMVCPRCGTKPFEK